MRSRISHGLWQGFFCCYRSDHNQSDFAFFTAPLRMFFYIFEENSLLKSHSNSLYVVLEACDFIRNERALKGCFLRYFPFFSIFFDWLLVCFVIF